MLKFYSDKFTGVGGNAVYVVLQHKLKIKQKKLCSCCNGTILDAVTSDIRKKSMVYNNMFPFWYTYIHIYIYRLLLQLKQLSYLSLLTYLHA